MHTSIALLFCHSGVVQRTILYRRFFVPGKYRTSIEKSLQSNVARAWPAIVSTVNRYVSVCAYHAASVAADGFKFHWPTQTSKCLFNLYTPMPSFNSCLQPKQVA